MARLVGVPERCHRDEAPLLANGEHIVVASTVDGAGNVGSYSQTITVDTVPPEVTIDGGEVGAPLPSASKGVLLGSTLIR